MIMESHEEEHYEEMNITPIAFEDLNEELLGKYLIENGIPENTVEAIRKEEINGQSFLTLTEEDLKEMKIKIGPRKILLKIIHSSQNREIDATTITPNLSDNFENEPQQDALPTPDTSTKTSQQDLRKVLQNHPQGHVLLEKLNSESLLSPEERKLFTRIAVGHLIATHGDCYPPSTKKTQLAKQIVSEFPCLKSPRTSGGYEHFYDPISGTGFIEFRLKTVRVKLTPTKKKNKFRAKKQVARLDLAISLLSHDDLQEKINWMSFKPPTPENRAAIVATLKETFANRHNDIISKKMYAGEVLEMYPRLMDYSGEMIDLEFRLSYKENDNFLGKFPEISKKLVTYAMKHRPNIINTTAHIKDDILRSLCILTELLVVKSISKKRKLNEPPREKQVELPRKELIVIKPLGASLDEAKPTDGARQQPYLVQLGRGFFLIIDHKEVYVGDSCLMAFDILFKSHFAFNVHFSQPLGLFYNFVANFLYQMAEEPPKPSAEMLNVALLNIQ